MISPHGRRRFLRTGVAGSLGLALAGKSPAQGSRAPSSCREALLPQEDPNPRSRRRRLERTRDLYVYDYERVPTVPMVSKLPLSEQFSFRWLAQGANRVADLLRNFAVKPNGRALASLAGGHAEGLLELARESAASSSSGSLELDRPESLEDYASLFRTIDLPAVAESYQDDRVFARHRVAGPNPLHIRRIPGLDDRFPVTDAIFRSVLPGDRLEAAAAEGRLYLADYRDLENVPLGLFRGVPKFLSAPLALFAVGKRFGRLAPVAIQCGQEPGPDNPIFTRHDGHGWTIAKTIVQIADANVHEAVSHLGRTHLFIEPFVIATERQLADSHPLRLLLRPHFEGTLAINELAHRTLLAPGGFVDELLAGTLEASIQLAVEGARSYSFEEAMLPAALRARGVDDPDVLPDYPYRDDALLYWQAIRTWVGDYLGTYYRSEADLEEDSELANWYRELVSPDGGRVPGFGRAGALGGLNDLIDAATLLIFTSSVQHAAVNFPQFDLMTYVPNMPLAGFSGPPPSNEAGEQELLDLLPPLSSARRQLVILYLLGTIHHTRLGEYGPGEICDPRIRGPLRAFQHEIDRIGTTIEERNRVRAPYPFLERRGIPQSINV
jgi:arachidonate 15-lipoxygenase